MTDSAYKVIDTLTKGRYTLSEVVHIPTGIKGIGIARRGQGDKLRPEVGVKIATNRAIKAIEKKKTKKKINNVLMG